jgi:nucleoside-diphosphate-sugar epimerase
MLTSKDLALPKGSRVLVTGANGYIASHVVDQLLKLGYIVRGTVRTPKPWLDEYFQQKYGDNVFETAVVTTFENQDGIDGVLGDVDGIVHAVRLNPSPFQT